MALAKTALSNEINFLLSNRIPRQLANRLFRRFSRIENPVLARAAIAAWRRFGDLDLTDSATQRFASVHECFTRHLKPGTRPIDTHPSVIVSPCDAIVGACGRIEQGQLIQAKGFPYRLGELLVDPQLARQYADGNYVTLRLTAGMYHRFHAPYDCSVERVTHIAGDTWNVNPIALARISKLFCRNERAVMPLALPPADVVITVVPVAAILVAGIRLHFVDLVRNRNQQGATEFPCRAVLKKGDEMGWFEHGSTIIVFAPGGVSLCPSVHQGAVIRTGNPLMRLP